MFDQTLHTFLLYLVIFSEISPIVLFYLLRSLQPLFGINLLKCNKFCSKRKLEVADRNFGLLKKNCLMTWQLWVQRQHIRQYLGCILESLNSNFACDNRYTYVILLQVGPQQSLLITIK